MEGFWERGGGAWMFGGGGAWWCLTAGEDSGVRNGYLFAAELLKVRGVNGCV
jgi:hypothetical protein